MTATMIKSHPMNRLKSTLGPWLFSLPALAGLAGLVMFGHLQAWVAFTIAVLILGGNGLWVSRREEQVAEPTDQTMNTAVAATILNALPDPVLLLDGKRQVLAANQAADELFESNPRDRDFATSLRQPEALAAVGEALKGSGSQRVEITLSQPVTRIFEFHAVTIAPGAAGPARAMVVFHDVTSAKNAQQMRADFVANVSHELRSPLSSLVGFIETLGDAAQQDAAARERFLAIMDGEARRMARLIDDLLSLSRVEANEHIRPDEKVDLALMIGAIADALSVKAEARNIEIMREGFDGLAPVAGDNDELTEVFTNLLDNAVKYGTEGSTVVIQVEPVERIPDIGGTGVVLRVKDKGEGIPPEFIPRLTERFYRIDKGRSRSMGGTGLGLAIVKHIVNRHRGRFIIESTIGEGSIFSVYLPLK
jgi:two-component system, OmpR family, phosphate regulon sensor histidine kinase PhoR